MTFKLGDEIMYQSPGSSVAIPHAIVAVRDNGKVVLRGGPGTRAVTVKIANIGHGQHSNKNYYVKTDDDGLKT